MLRRYTLSYYENKTKTQQYLQNYYIIYIWLYFSRWVVVCGWWCIAARKWTRSNGGSPGTQGNREDRGFGLEQGCSTVGTVASWGLPAVHTIAVLITRDVDADELTGECKFHRICLIYRSEAHLRLFPIEKPSVNLPWCRCLAVSLTTGFWLDKIRVTRSSYLCHVYFINRCNAHIEFYIETEFNLGLY